MPTPDQKIIRAEQGAIRPTMENNISDPMRVFSNEKMEAYDQTDLSFESMVEDKSSIVPATPIRGLSARHIQMISLGGCIG
jgi:amino acid permease